MNIDGRNYDLQAILFEIEPCVGCAFVHEHCMELVGSKCEDGGNFIWVEVEDA